MFGNSGQFQLARVPSYPEEMLDTPRHSPRLPPHNSHTNSLPGAVSLPLQLQGLYATPCLAPGAVFIPVDIGDGKERAATRYPKLKNCLV